MVSSTARRTPATSNSETARRSPVSSVVKSIIAAAAAFALSATLLTSCGANAASPDSAITVSAESATMVAPDKASVKILVKTRANTPEAAKADAARISNDVRARIKTAGAPDSAIEVTTADPVAVYGTISEEQVPAGYYDWYGNWIETGGTVSMWIDRTSEVVGQDVETTIYAKDIAADSLAKVLKESAAAGATGYADLSFYISDRAAAYAQALTSAIDQAHAKAETMANASKVYVGRVVNMVENSTADELVLNAAGDAAALNPADITTLDVVPTTLPIAASVTVSYAIS